MVEGKNAHLPILHYFRSLGINFGYNQYELNSVSDSNDLASHINGEAAVQIKLSPTLVLLVITFRQRNKTEAPAANQT
jgi:hypothetical protein